jgi:hypothetical protein
MTHNRMQLINIKENQELQPGQSVGVPAESRTSTFQICQKRQPSANLFGKSCKFLDKLLHSGSCFITTEEFGCFIVYCFTELH